MKKKFIIFTLLLLLILPYWIHNQIKAKKLDPKKLFVKSSITILYPNGGEKWKKSKKYCIQWKSNGIKGTVKIKLKWGMSSGGWYTVTNSTDNDGSFDYIVPKSIGQTGDRFKIYVMNNIESVKDESDGFFSIIEKGVIHLHAPVFRFSFPKKGDVLQRGKQYTLVWRQIRRSSEDLSYLKIILLNLRTKQKFIITQNTVNKGYYNFTLPVSAPDGIYIFEIMLLNESFVNQSHEFKIGSFDLICEIRNVVKIEGSTFASGTIGFEIWIMNRGTDILSSVPVVWRIISKKDNRVLIQKEAGFSNIYPNRYYASKRIYIPPIYLKYKPLIIEVEVDPKNTLHESKESRKNNIVRRVTGYDMHIKGHK